MPPPAEGFASRLILGPALRAQPDRRLVTLVREGYESAFEEIVRRYGKPLTRYAAAIVGSRSEDVTQDAFSKALLALRRDGAEIELRPWLYRIVRNTALNDIRDNPPPPEVLAEAIASGRSAAEEVEQREEMTELIRRLRALPEPQRAAIVMRELEGLSHEEIAAALGLSGGAARQAIYRARQALRDGAGLLLPLPLLRFLADHGAEAGAGVGAGAGGAIAAGSAAGGAGAGGALKAGAVAAVLAGSVGTGIALQEDRGERGEAQAADPVVRVAEPSRAPATLPPALSAPAAPSVDSGESRGGSRSSGEGRGEPGGEDRSGPGPRHGPGGRGRRGGGEDFGRERPGRNGRHGDRERPEGGREGPGRRGDPGEDRSGPGPDGKSGRREGSSAHEGPGGGDLGDDRLREGGDREGGDRGPSLPPPPPEEGEDESSGPGGGSEGEEPESERSGSEELP